MPKPRRPQSRKRRGGPPRGAPVAGANPPSGATGPGRGRPRRLPAGGSEDIVALGALGRAARSRGDLDRALDYFRRALSVDPDNAPIHTSLADAYLALGRPGDAMRHHRAAVAADPNFAPAYAGLGHLFSFQDRDLEAAVACYRRAVEIDPKRAANWCGLGTALRRLGKPREAASALGESLRVRDDDVVAHHQMGLAMTSLGRPDEARECFERVLALAPGEVYAHAAIASLEAAAGGRPALGKDAKRVALHMNQSFHYSFLRPLFDAVAKRHHARFACEARELVEFDPDVVIVADAQSGALRAQVPRACYVMTRHGVISKKVAYAMAALADYVCVTSETVQGWYVANGGIPRKGFWITGYVQMDPLFGDDPLPLPFELPKDGKTVLYAPTFNPKLSSAPMMGERLVPLIRGPRDDLSIVIKPHPHIPARQPAWMDWWRAAERDDPRVHLVEDAAADLVPYLKAADVLVSDASSAAFLFLALDRPIVLVTNPEAAQDKDRYDPGGIEWRWRDVGEEVHDVGGLAEAVARALDDPARHAARRAEYGNALFGTLTDGRAAERIVEHVTALRL